MFQIHKGVRFPWSKYADRLCSDLDGGSDLPWGDTAFTVYISPITSLLAFNDYAERSFESETCSLCTGFLSIHFGDVW